MPGEGQFIASKITDDMLINELLHRGVTQSAGDLGDGEAMK